MNRFSLLTGLFVLGSASLGCTVPVSGEDTASDDQAIAGDGTSTYFIVTRPDLRKCAYPTCGGVFVQRVNHTSTKCADGVYRSECHVADVDLASIGLADADAAKFQDTFAESYGIVRGSLSRVTDAWGHAVDTLGATEAWVTATLSPPTGTFYGLSSRNIECFAYPCPSVLEEKLNSTVVHDIADVDLTPSGANSKQIAQAMDMLSTTGILASGSNHAVHGPGGTSSRISASQFYTRLLPAPVVTCGGVTCGNLEYCCNASCGICAPAGESCLQTTCN
jgi:hypothetical protein